MSVINNSVDPSIDPNASVSSFFAGISAAVAAGKNVQTRNLTFILNQIYALLTKMIGVMQNITAVQAQRLNILTQWQAAYTDALSKVHNFTLADGIPDNIFKNSSSNQTQLTSISSTMITTLQGSRSAISDDSKSLQSSVNSSNDAVTQQANLATSFLQELTTLLQAVYR